MRRTKGGFLHPALKTKLGDQGLERLVSDAAGVKRVSEPGNRVDYLPIEPDLDITSYHEQIDFKDAGDTNTTITWIETGVNDANGSALTVVDWGGSEAPHGSLTSGNTLNDYWQYQRRNLNYYPMQGDDNKLWFLSRIQLAGSRNMEVYIGYTEIGDATLSPPDNGYGFFYDPSNDSWYFRIDFTTPEYGHRANSINLGEGSADWVDLSFSITYDGGQAILDVYSGDNFENIFIDGLTPGVPLFDMALHLTFGNKSVVPGQGGLLHLQYLKTITGK